MLCTVTVRRLTPGTYDQFRAVVEPEYWPAGLTNVLVLRNDEDPDEVCTIGYFDISADDLEHLRDTPEVRAAEARRLERVAAFAETVIVNGIFEVVDDMRPRAA